MGDGEMGNWRWEIEMREGMCRKMGMSDCVMRQDGDV